MQNLTQTATLIRQIIAEKGYTINEIYRKLGKNRCVYTAFEKNRFSKEFLTRVSNIIGEDLTMFANCYTARDIKEMKSGKENTSN
jgi:hypothetical protein